MNWVKPHRASQQSRVAPLLSWLKPRPTPRCSGVEQVGLVWAVLFWYHTMSGEVAPSCVERFSLCYSGHHL